MFCRSGANRTYLTTLEWPGWRGDQINCQQQKGTHPDPGLLLQTVINHLKTAISLSLLCLSFLADTQRLTFHSENQVLWCKISPRAIYKNSWVCAHVCISHCKEENQDGTVCHLRSSVLSWSSSLPEQTSTKEEKQSTFIL